MDETDEIKRQAAEDFSRARAEEIFSRIMHFMDPRRFRRRRHPGNSLLSLDDVREILKPSEETYRGMEAVPIDRIVGSEGRYQDFNKYFLPRGDHLRSRWERVDRARLNDIILPPIRLYEIGGVYFVRDGNHRVSVAKSQGIEMIDAEVTSLSTAVQFTPGMSLEELKKTLLDYEKTLFYKKTGFGTIPGFRDMDFTTPGLFDKIYNHILVHKYYLNLTRPLEVSFEEAASSWYRKVYAPIDAIIKDEKLTALFPGRTPGDLYIWMVRHWDDLKKKYGIHYSLSDAVHDFSSRYGSPHLTPLALIKSFFINLVRSRGPGSEVSEYRAGCKN